MVQSRGLCGQSGIHHQHEQVGVCVCAWQTLCFTGSLLSSILIRLLFCSTLHSLFSSLLLSLPISLLSSLLSFVFGPCFLTRFIIHLYLISFTTLIPSSILFIVLLSPITYSFFSLLLCHSAFLSLLFASSSSSSIPVPFFHSHFYFPFHFIILLSMSFVILHSPFTQSFFSQFSSSFFSLLSYHFHSILLQSFLRWVQSSPHNSWRAAQSVPVRWWRAQSVRLI